MNAIHTDKGRASSWDRGPRSRLREAGHRGTAERRHRPLERLPPSVRPACRRLGETSRVSEAATDQQPGGFQALKLHRAYPPEGQVTARV